MRVQEQVAEKLRVESEVPAADLASEYGVLSDPIFSVRANSDMSSYNLCLLCERAGPAQLGTW